MRVLNSSRTIANVLGGRLGGRLQETTTRKSVKLTAVQIRAPLAPGKYHDGGGLGLYLLVKPSGARSWMQRIIVQGRRRELGLGSPPVVTLARAREVALENKRLVRDGVDPLQARKEAEAVPTFEEAARAVHKLRAAADTEIELTRSDDVVMAEARKQRDMPCEGVLPLPSIAMQPACSPAAPSRAGL